MPFYKIKDAITAAIIQEMEQDDKIILLGEDIAVLGGAYGVTSGILERFGENRIFDTPISENAIVGAAVGAAMTGYRPIVEIQFNDFLTCCMDQLCNQAAKMRFMMGGQVRVPMVVRAPYGATGRAAQHSQSLEAWFAHTPGLKVVMPSTPYDAKGLMKAAIRDDNPVLFFEHKLLYGGSSAGGKALSAVDKLGSDYRPAPEEEYLVPLGSADIKRQGQDVTVIATGLMVHKAILAADLLLGLYGIRVEVVDLRSIVPLDEDCILSSVQKTKHVVIASEDVCRCGVTAEISAVIAEKAFSDLAAPIMRVAVNNSPIPFAPECEKHALPDEKTIMDAIRRILGLDQGRL